MSVYFAQVGRYIKIGCSDDPQRRVRRLFSSTTRYSAPADCPLELSARRLLLVIPGWTNREAECHRALDDFRVIGEFFIDEPEVRTFMARAEAGDFTPIERPSGSYFDEHSKPANPDPKLRETLDRLFDPTPEMVANLDAMIARYNAAMDARGVA